VTINDLVGDPEAETRACRSLGGEEGVKDLAHGLGLHAAAGVGHSYANAFLCVGRVGCGANAQQDSTWPGNGVEGIADEVDHDLAQFALLAQDGWDRQEAGFDGDA